MPADIPTTEPAELVVGDRWQWTRTLDDYSADDGWALAYYLANAGTKRTITTTGSGTTYTVDVLPTSSALYTAGRYAWQAVASKSGDRKVIGSGRVILQPNFASASTTSHDGRTHARKVLDAIEAVLERRASKDQESYVITTGGMSRSLSRTPLADLLVLRDKYRVEVAREEAAATGNTMGMRRVYVRFGSA